MTPHSRSILLGPLNIILLNLGPPDQLQIAFHILISGIFNLHIPQFRQRRRRFDQITDPRWILLPWFGRGHFGLGWILCFGVDGFEAWDGRAGWQCKGGGCRGEE